MNTKTTLSDLLLRGFKKKPLSTRLMITIRNAIFMFAGASLMDGHWFALIIVFFIGYMFDDMID